MDQSIRIILQFVDQASAGLARTTGVIQGTVGGMQGVIGGTFTKITGIVGGAVGRIKNFITGMASHMKWASFFIGSLTIGIGAKMLGMVANVEQTRVAFETLLGSKPEAGDLLEWMTKLSIKTPVTRMQIQDLARTLLAYGHNLEQTKLATMAVIEATSALGISETRIQAITYNLGQIAASTTVSYREFRDIQKQGINTGKLLAKAVNDGQIKLSGFAATTGTARQGLIELTREQQEAILKQNKGIDIAIALEEQMLKTYGGAALRQVKTLSGLMSNFGDVFQLVLQKAMGISVRGEVQIGGAFDKIRNAAAKVVEFLIDNADKIGNFFNKLLSNKNALIGLASFFIGIFIPAIVGIIAPVIAAGIIFGLLGIAINKVIELGGGWEAFGKRIVDSVKRAQQSIEEWKELFKNVYNTIRDFIIGIQIFFEDIFLPTIKNAKDKALGFIEGLVSGIRNKFVNLVSSAWNWGHDLVENFINGIKSMAERVRNIAREGGIVGKLMQQAGFQHGGIVPGPIGAPMPIIAHGGERVVPRTGVEGGMGGGTGVTINMNGPITMDSPERVKQLADAIIRILGRQNELARFGVGYNFV